MGARMTCGALVRTRFIRDGPTTPDGRLRLAGFGLGSRSRVATHRVGDLEIGQDLAFERRQEQVRRLSAVAGAALLLAALLGVFGAGGPFAHAEVSSGAVTVEYERFTRYEAQTNLDIEVSDSEGETDIALARSYLQDVSVENISPEPESATVAPDRTVYTFDLEPGATVTFELKPERFGSKDAVVWGPQGGRAEFNQFVYP